jgi:ferrochelatase
MPRTGVLIAGFGGPDSIEAVGPFMCNLMGREPSGALLARICEHYERIGGSSPLVGIARELAGRVTEALAASGHDVPVEVGMRYWDPFIEDAVAALAAAGVEHVVMVTLSPFETQVTHGEYRLALEDALAVTPGLTAEEMPLLSVLPAFAALHAEGVATALAGLGSTGAPVVFSAHSLPTADAAADPAYVGGLRVVADAVAGSLGLVTPGAECEPLPGVFAYGNAAGPRVWLLAYQSQGARGGEWLGPGTTDAVRAAAAAGHAGVAVAPIGFATDHMETLYDIDIVTAEAARDAGIAFARSAVPNADPRLAADIAAVVEERIEALG